MTTTTLSTGAVSFGSASYISASNASAVYTAAASIPTLTNAGTIVESGGNNYAISFAGSGTVINSGSITGASGIYVRGTAAAITNTGAVRATGTTGVGIKFAGGGGISNQSTGTISGVFDGISLNAGTLTNAGLINGQVFSAGAAAINNLVTGTIQSTRGNAIYGGATVTNAGIITDSTSNGIRITGPATVTNQSTGTISAHGGGIVINGNATVANAGGVTAATGDGVFLLGGGAVANQSVTASISGGQDGIYVKGGAGTITNEGAISGSAENGIYLQSGGSIGNSGTITGFRGVVSSTSDPITVSNYGLIGGSHNGMNLNDGGVLTNGGLITGVFSYGTFSLDNLSGGTIASTAANGVYLDTFTGTVTNAGSIGATNGDGVRATNGVSVTNASTGTITGAGGGDGIFVSNQPGTITNEGTIRGSHSASNGIYLQDGGTITNSGTHADIYGYNIGVLGSSGASITLLNSGTIFGDENAGIQATGAITNSPGGKIEGIAYGVVLGAGSTFTNAGLVEAVVGTYAVKFTGGGRLVLDPEGGSVGVIAGGGASTLELAGTGTPGALTDIGSVYTGFSQVTVDTGANWTIGTIVAAVTVTAGDGSLTVGGALVTGASFDLDSTGTGETLILNGVTGNTLANSVVNLSHGDKIVLPHLSFAAGDTVEQGGTNIAAIFQGSTQVFSFTNLTVPVGTTPADIVIGSDFIQNIACFRAGTRIATSMGPVAVEALRVGDLIEAVFGGMVEVAWLGHRSIDCRRHPRPQQVWPVRVAAGAFGAGLPRRDLWLSPDHAVYVEDMLVPIRCLINGATIRQEPRGEVTYWHVELRQHDAILAEGLPCESYLDTGNRAAFANGAGAVTPDPDFAERIWEVEACAPLVCHGASLVSLRRALLARAEALGHDTTGNADRTVVVDNCGVIEQGRQEELLAAGGAYRRLHDVQFGA